MWVGNALAGISLVVFVGGAVVYEQYLSPILQDTTVWVAATNIPPNTLLTAHNVKTELVPRRILETGAITNPVFLRNKRSATLLAANQQLTAKDLETNALTPVGNEQIYPIPSSWIYAIGGGIRRGDSVSIYAYPKNNTPGTPSNSFSTSKTTTQTATSSSQSVASVILSHVAVEYVRNGSNQEITNASPNALSSTNPYAQQENGNGTPTTVDLLLTPVQFQQLKTLSLTNQFIFSYPSN
ncbi:SAF domain-containing protein [Alicyclobacillus ferrooxydans]|uniref:SAF domain-containing protein n=1 Tax=Alicyclobacillus ferrooxydans TaxID=471514 RepID=A0A0P9CB74_9BACL|nr:SAF domain-containing protein [Alicyclobacillus ferrooxydans]KPV42686.1 hypothetical protein AN477_16265 [Alicyclobacillus ferrooxydans]